jgi:fido (protein-threonine AMPylation protein)
MTSHSTCHTTPNDAPQKRASFAAVSLSSHSPKASQRIRAVPKIAGAEAYRFYFAIGLTRAFAEFLRMPTETVTLTDFMRLHALLFSAVAPWAGKLRSKHTEVIVFRRAAAASFDLRSEMRLASLQFEALMRRAKDFLDQIVAIAFIHVRIIYIQPAAEGNECAAQVLTDLQLRRIFGPIELRAWPTDDSYATALTVAASGELTPIVHLINARLQERKIPLPAGRVIQSPFDVLSKNWTSPDKNLPDSELLLSAARLPSDSTQAPATVGRRSLSLFPSLHG